MAQEGDSVTLTCTEAASTPPANTTWRKGLQQEDVMPGLKYTLSEEGPVLRLTVRNLSKDDEGVYFCRSENLLGVRELEVYLTVRSESGGGGPSPRTRCLSVSSPQASGCAGMLINPLPLPWLCLLTSCFASTASSAYTGVIIGIFVAAVIVASPVVLAKSLHANRHRICLGDMSRTIPPVTPSTYETVACLTDF